MLFNADGLLSKWLLARVVKADAKLYNLEQMMLWKEKGTFTTGLNSHGFNVLKNKKKSESQLLVIVDQLWDSEFSRPVVK